MTDKIPVWEALKLLGFRMWQNPNGTWSHHRDSKREWNDYASCATDLRFHEEWAR